MESQQFSSSTTEKLTLCFMVIAIFASALWGLESWFEAQIASCRSEQYTRRRELTENIAARTDPTSFQTRSILPILRLLSEKPDLDLNALREMHLRKTGLTMFLYQFNSRGELIRTAPQKAPNIWLMRNLFPALRETDNHKVALARKNLDKKIEHAFGFGKDLNSIRENPEIIINTVSSEREGLLTWTSRKNGGLIITCPQIPSQRDIFALMAPQNLTDTKPAKLGIIDDNRQTNQLVQKARRHLQKDSSDSGYFAGLQWFFVNTRTNVTVFTAFQPVLSPFSRARHLMRLLYATAVFAIFTYILIHGVSLTISLKKLVVAMFFTSSLIPISGIAFSTFDNLEVYSQIHTNRLRAVKEESLSNLVQNFNKYLASCSANLNKITALPGAGAKDPLTIAMNKKIMAMFPEAKLTLRNSAGNLLFSNTPHFASGREEVFKSLSRRLIERYSPERLEEHRYSGNPFSDSMVRKDDMGFGTLLNYPGRLQLVNTGNSEILLFYRMLPASVGQTAVTQIELSIFATVKRYLQSLKSLPQSGEAENLQIAAFYPKGFRWSRPPQRTHEQQLLQLAETAYATGKAQFRRFAGTINGFALCVPAAELAGNCLIAFSSAAPLDEALTDMKTRILFGTLLVCFLLVSVATLISKQLIEPIGKLESGIKALAQRNFETRLPALPGQDELARLFGAFNDMMAESYDMQIAHNVQEGLVPTQFPDIKNYSIHGMLRAASDLGGDCLDCFLLPNGQLLFLVGDLTGHGVGSALMMAFTRAVTFHWSQGGNLSPASLTDHIDAMLRENRTERMFMGIICGVLDPATHQIELVTKGHIYPLKIGADGSKQWVGIPAYPLGVAKQQPAKSQTFFLAPGDSLLCMTDGFLEAYNRQLRSIGFDGIEEWASEKYFDDAKTWVSHLDNRFKAWCDGRQSDDISIFAIKRSFAGDEHAA